MASTKYIVKHINYLNMSNTIHGQSTRTNRIESIFSTIVLSESLDIEIQYQRNNAGEKMVYCASVSHCYERLDYFLQCRCEATQKKRENMTFYQLIYAFNAKHCPYLLSSCILTLPTPAHARVHIEKYILHCQPCLKTESFHIYYLDRPLSLSISPPLHLFLSLTLLCFATEYIFFHSILHLMRSLAQA